MSERAIIEAALGVSIPRGDGVSELRDAIARVISSQDLYLDPTDSADAILAMPEMQAIKEVLRHRPVMWQCSDECWQEGAHTPGCHAIDPLPPSVREWVTG